MSKHTPGPWQPSKSRTNPYAVYAPHGQTTRSSIASIALYDDCYDEAEANARLIAAAPELLEALLAVWNAGTGASPEVKDASWELARAAIANATGTENKETK